MLQVQCIGLRRIDEGREFGRMLLHEGHSLESLLQAGCSVSQSKGTDGNLHQLQHLLLIGNHDLLIPDLLNQLGSIVLGDVAGHIGHQGHIQSRIEIQEVSPALGIDLGSHIVQHSHILEFPIGEDEAIGDPSEFLSPSPGFIGSGLEKVEHQSILAVIQLGLHIGSEALHPVLAGHCGLFIADHTEASISEHQVQIRNALEEGLLGDDSLAELPELGMCVGSGLGCFQHSLKVSADDGGHQVILGHFKCIIKDGGGSTLHLHCREERLHLRVSRYYHGLCFSVS